MSETDDNAAVIDAPAPAGGDEVTWENSPIAQVYNPDGSPKETAATALEELGHGEFAGHALRNGQDIFTALKSGKDAFTQASQRQEGVSIPGEDATDEDRRAFSTALGVPDDAEAIKAGIWPEDLPDDFQKDEGLADILATHALESPVLTQEGIQGLASKFIAHQQEQTQKAIEEQTQAATEAATKTKDGLTVEFGGTEKYAEFSDEVRKEATTAMNDLGFDFRLENDENGEPKMLVSDNPLHQAMLADAPTLRLLKTVMDLKRPAGIPGQEASSHATQEENMQKAMDLKKKHPMGFPDQKTLDEYNGYMGMAT